MKGYRLYSLHSLHSLHTLCTLILHPIRPVNPKPQSLALIRLLRTGDHWASRIDQTLNSVRWWSVAFPL